MDVKQIHKQSANIFTVGIASPYFSSVKKLWQFNSDILGHFPAQAFAHFAENGRILGALDGQENFVGYLLYRLFPMKGKASVLYVCVDSLYRRNGVCSALIEHVKEKTQGLQGISLLCREGQQWEQIWSRLGFTVLKDTVHKSWDGKPLNLWWYDHGHPALLSEREKSHEKLSVVLDADVLYALQDKQGAEQEDTHTLLADWLQESLVLCLTDEVFNTINRRNDRLEREYRRAFGGKFCRIPTDQSAVRVINRQLECIFAFSIKDNDESARLHLAGAIAAAAPCFVTQNIMLLNRAEHVYDTFGISILSPLELILNLNELIRESEYQPFRLQGIQLQGGASQEEKKTLLFRLYMEQPQKKEIERIAESNLNEEVWILKDKNKQPLGLVAYLRKALDTLEIPVLRLQKGSLLPTLARYTLHRAIQTAWEEGRLLVRITEPQLSTPLAEALYEHGFIPTPLRGWTKCNLALAEPSHMVVEKLERLSREFRKDKDFFQHILSTAQAALASKDTLSLYELERALWPLKITDLNIPAIIVPIKPDWAMHLFDHRIAQETLFHTDIEHTMKCENACLRQARPKSLKAPGRILWHVIQGRFESSMQIRACSYLDEVVIDRPDPLYRQFHRLSVYTWQNILQIAKHDKTCDLMALRFSGTELFQTPVEWNVVQQVLTEDMGKPFRLTSPLHISAKCFFQLYRLGTK